MTIHSHANQDALNDVPDPSTGSVGQAITVKSGGGYELTTVGGSGSGDVIKKAINQSSHGLSAGDVVRYNGTVYTKAQADSADNAEAVGIVESVTDTNNFVLVEEGFVTISGMSWTAGASYRLSAVTAGALTSDDPEEGEIVRYVLNAISSTTAWLGIKLGVVHRSVPPFRNPQGILPLWAYATSLHVLDFINETFSVVTTSGWSNVHRNSGLVNSKYRGYAVGYRSGAAKGTQVDALRFVDYAALATAMVNRTSGAEQACTQTDEKGWLINNSDSAVQQGYRDITKVVYDMELLGTLVWAISACMSRTGVSSDTYGYGMGGRVYGGATPGLTSSIQRVKFSDDSVSLSSASLSVAKYSGMGFNSTTKGYHAGGYDTSTYYTSIEALTYLGESISTVSGSLSQGRFTGGAVNSWTYGYVCGGSNGSDSQRVDRLDFSDDSVSNLGDSLMPSAQNYETAGSGWQTHGII